LLCALVHFSLQKTASEIQKHSTMLLVCLQPSKARRCARRAGL
jgi:hypothetical protein